MKISIPKISIVMGSQSDWSTLKHTGKILKELKIVHEKKIVSAHRTPKRLYEYAEQAYDRGIKIIIAGAGGSAHLPGMIAAITHIPVIGVPIESKTLKGLDSLLSIAQMPFGIPVGTVAIGENGAKNAALYAASIISNYDPNIERSLVKWRLAQTKKVKKTPR
jgi:5-(carboxyamino)imidazole ribonucleotide mutase